MSRKSISLSDSVESKANFLIQNQVGDGLSDLIARLIREEWERRHAQLGVQLHDAMTKNPKETPLAAVGAAGNPEATEDYPPIKRK